MPWEMRACYDKATAQESRTGESGMWVPDVVQDIYNKAVNKHEAFPRGQGGCGPEPAAKFAADGWHATATDLVRSPETDQLILELGDAQKPLKIDGPVRIDFMENDKKLMVRDPGEPQPGIPNTHLTDAKKIIFTYKDADNKTTSIETTKGFRLIDKTSPD